VGDRHQFAVDDDDQLLQFVQGALFTGRDIGR